MRLAMAAFVAGVVMAAFAPRVLPVVPLLALTLLFLGVSFRFPFVRFLAAWVAGLLWLSWAANDVVSGRLPASLDGSVVMAEGVVAALPDPGELHTSFRFHPETVDGLSASEVARLGDWWVSAPADLRWRVGQRWRISIRLQSLHGLYNPGTYDREQWFATQRIGGSGKVLSGTRLADTPAGIEGWRQRLQDEWRPLIARMPELGVVMALVDGDRSEVSAVQWDLYAATGITHLMAISGLHVTMFAALVMLLVHRLWSMSSSLLLRLPARHAAVSAGLVSATLYSLFAGFSVPTQRTLVMLFILGICELRYWRMTAADALLLALVGVVMLDALSVLDVGWWLSFGAVSVILFAISGQRGKLVWWREWGRVQLWVFIGLLPLSLWFFGRVSLVSPVTNIVAIPVITWGIVPLAMMGSALLPVWSAGGEFLLSVTAFEVSLLEQFLSWFLLLPMPWWSGGVHSVAWLLIASAGLLLVLMPLGWTIRAPALLILGVAVLQPAERPGRGDFSAIVLDVGQGLSVAVKTREHWLLYDTGPAWAGVSVARRTVVPWLEQRGVRQLDRLMVSHDDMDHSGGLESVLARIPANTVHAEKSVLDNHKVPAGVICSAGQSWEWDGVTFDVLNPVAGATGVGGDNTRSCVLRIVGVGGSLLLTGDLDIEGEARLLNSGAELQSDVLVVGHHGSKTSSGDDFLKAVGAGYGVISAGYRNRYGHPHASVVKRLAAHQIKMLQTSECGAVLLEVGRAAGIKAECSRQDDARWWRGEEGLRIWRPELPWTSGALW